MTCCNSDLARAPALGARAFVRKVVAIVAVFTVSIGTTTAAPYTPTSDAIVLETLPFGAAMRPKMHPVQMDLDGAVQLARDYVHAARQSGDSRYLGYARAVLKPWSSSPSASLSVVLIQAEIEQHEHRFAIALQLLDRVAHDQPRLAAVHQMRAAIYQVQGHYVDAQRECRYLILQTSALSAVDCVARTMSRNGNAQRAYDMLSHLQATTTFSDPIELRDSHLTLAEIAVQLGDVVAARTHYMSAMKLAEPDAYTLATYTDFLLDQQEFAAVIELAQLHPDNQDLKIRAALSAQATHAANPWATEVRDLIASYRSRGDFKVTRDYARFLLDVERDPPRALQAALENWQSQREPPDALIVMRAALRCSPSAAAPVMAFITSNHIDDTRLKSLVETLKRSGVAS
jgi:tetratricopeptide (TPR) repeat protein